jgi:hypothetical protein
VLEANILLLFGEMRKALNEKQEILTQQVSEAFSFPGWVGLWFQF